MPFRFNVRRSLNQGGQGGFTPPTPQVLLGVYAPNWGDAVAQNAGLYGRSLDYGESHSGRADPADYVNSIGYVLGQNDAKAPTQKRLALPFFHQGGSLSAAASGAYDSMWTQAANATLSAIPGQSTIYVRIGWEMNHNFQPWGIVDGSTPNAQKAADYVTAWRRIIPIFRAAAAAAGRMGVFRFVWCINIGDYDYTPAYPGDDMVDVIGVDMYHQPQYGQPTEGAAAWTFQRTRSYGFDSIFAFAKAHNKPFSIPEWGVSDDSFGPTYIRSVYQHAIDNAQFYDSTCWWAIDDPGSYSSWLGNRPNLLAWARYMVNRAVYPTQPVVPAYTLGSNIFAAPTDLTNGAWQTYIPSGGSLTRNSATSLTASADGGGKSFYTSQNTPVGKYIQEATITRTAGTGTFVIEYYGGPDRPTGDGYYNFSLDVTKLPLNQRTKVEVLWDRQVNDANHNFGFAFPQGIGAVTLTIENQSLKPVSGDTSRWASGPVFTPA